MDVFLFPLPKAVLYPGTIKPLHVFESRYIQMVRDSIATQTPIALAYVDDLSRIQDVVVGQVPAFVRPVAGYGSPLILEERPDGSLLIVVQGQGKTQLGEIRIADPYVVVSSEPIDETWGCDDSCYGKIGELRALLTSWIRLHVTDKSQQRHFIDSIRNSEEVIGCLASFLVRDSDLQQYLLEINDVSGKVGFLDKMIYSADYRNAA